MADSAPIVLHLELDGVEEPISGRLSASSGRPVAFTGWVGLASAIETALGQRLPQAGPVDA